MSPRPTEIRRLVGRYRLDSELGRGAMGTVWSAYDEVLHRPVAVKEVRLSLVPVSERAIVRERTLREARATAMLSHPNVVTLYDVVEVNAEPYVVMELLPSRSLASYISERGTLSPAETAEIGSAVASALMTAHRAGITHRDVKPGNVLIGTDGQIKLTDFGIARNSAESSMTQTGTVLGSPPYIAPEVAMGRAVGPAADLWGLGATLFACLEGRPPYDAGDPVSTVSAVVHGEVPRPKGTGPVQDVVRGLMVKDPTLRMPLPAVRRRLRPLMADPEGPMLSAPPSPATTEFRLPTATRPSDDEARSGLIPVARGRDGTLIDAHPPGPAPATPPVSPPEAPRTAPIASPRVDEAGPPTQGAPVQGVPDDASGGTPAEAEDSPSADGAAGAVAAGAVAAGAVAAGAVVAGSAAAGPSTEDAPAEAPTDDEHDGDEAGDDEAPAADGTDGTDGEASPAGTTDADDEAAALAEVPAGTPDDEAADEKAPDGKAAGEQAADEKAAVPQEAEAAPDEGAPDGVTAPKSGTAKTGATKTGTAKTGATKPGATKPGATKPGATKPGAADTSPATADADPAGAAEDEAVPAEDGTTEDPAAERSVAEESAAGSTPAEDTPAASTSTETAAAGAPAEGDEPSTPGTTTRAAAAAAAAVAGTAAAGTGAETVASAGEAADPTESESTEGDPESGEDGDPPRSGTTTSSGKPPSTPSGGTRTSTTGTGTPGRGTPSSGMPRPGTPPGGTPSAAETTMVTPRMPLDGGRPRPPGGPTTPGAWPMAGGPGYRRPPPPQQRRPGPPQALAADPGPLPFAPSRTPGPSSTDQRRRRIAVIVLVVVLALAGLFGGYVVTRLVAGQPPFSISLAPDGPVVDGEQLVAHSDDNARYSGTGLGFTALVPSTWQQFRLQEPGGDIVVRYVSEDADRELRIDRLVRFYPAQTAADYAQLLADPGRVGADAVRVEPLTEVTPARPGASEAVQQTVYRARTGTTDDRTTWTRLIPSGLDLWVVRLTAPSLAPGGAPLQFATVADSFSPPV